MIPEFPKADCYDCRNSETLSHETPEEAIEYLIDNEGLPRETMGEIIKRLAPVTVTGYVRRLVTDEWIGRIAGSVVEGAVDSWEEEYGDPDGVTGDAITTKAVTRAEGTVARALRELYADARVWPCDPIKPSIVLDAAQVEEMMRAYNPEWFEEKP